MLLGLELELELALKNANGRNPFAILIGVIQVSINIVNKIISLKRPLLHLNFK